MFILARSSPVLLLLAAFGISSTTFAAAPSVASSPATSVTGSSATLQAVVDPAGEPTVAWFRYGTSSPGTCNDTFGSKVPSTGSDLGSGNGPIQFSHVLSGLTPGVTYYFCVLASNASGTTLGSLLSFTTTPLPAVFTVGASLTGPTSAALSGSVVPRGADTLGWFRLGTTSPGTCNDAYGVRVPQAGGTAVGAGTTTVPFSEQVTGLVPGTTYYFCAIASNSSGTSYASLTAFVVPAAPTVVTGPVNSAVGTYVSLPATVSSNGASTTAWFRYSTVDPGTCDDNFGVRLPGSGGTSVYVGAVNYNVSQSVSGLTPGTTYYYCAIASNSMGTSYGAVLSFRTSAVPLVTTVAPELTTTVALLKGTVEADGLSPTAWFRYDTSDPGICNTTFGTSAGNAPVNASTMPATFSRTLTLVPDTTYYFCAIASSASGTGFGAVLSFTSPAAPAVTTSGVTGVTASDAVLNASANPKGSETTAWFRFGPSNPGTCNDTFGWRVPATGGQALGDGRAAVAWSQAISNLTAGATYYYCAIASNALGTTFGAVKAFSAKAPPSASTTSVTGLTDSAAVLNGSAQLRGDASQGWFRYAPTHPGSCDDTFGMRAPATGGIDLGSGYSQVNFSEPITGLTGGVTYYYCAIASSAFGTTFGAVKSFTTPTAPTMVTLGSSNVGSTTVTLSGSGVANGALATAWFRFSTTHPGTCDDTIGVRAPFSGISIGAGSATTAVSTNVTGLSPATTYYYCIVGSNLVGKSYGAVLSFTTTGPPTVTTQSATSVTSSAAVLNGSAAPNGVLATGWFRYSATPFATCTDTFGTRAPASGGASLGSSQTGATPWTQAISGLTPGTTYHYCAVASNAVGTSFGQVETFTTAPVAPVVTTVGHLTSGTTITLQGTVNPGGTTAGGWFRLGTAPPGACNDTFGLRVPSSGSVPIAAGNSPLPFQVIEPLASGATYYFCAVASNSVGTRFGAIRSFKVPSKPTVTSQPVTDIKGTSAVAKASATPNRDAAMGWFRYYTSAPTSGCVDSGGVRAPLSGGTSLGSGETPVPFTQTLAGLKPSTTYFVCAFASNGVGTSAASEQTFTTLSAPAVTTSSASDVLSESAVLNGSANPNLTSTTGWFRFGTEEPARCDDTYGTRVPGSGGAALGSGTEAMGWAEPVSALAPGRTYYFCAVASNEVGSSFGEIVSFTTGVDPPLVSTLEATELAARTATLNGSAVPNRSAAEGWFRFSEASPEACDDTFGTRVPATGALPLGSGATPAEFAAAIEGLRPKTEYSFCAIASNQGGASFGELARLQTSPEAPVTTTLPARIEAGAPPELRGSADLKGSSGSAWFQVLQDPSQGCTVGIGEQQPSQPLQLAATHAPVEFSFTMQKTPEETIHYCAVVVTEAGAAYGELLTIEGEASLAAGGCGCGTAGSPAGLAVLLTGLLLFAAHSLRRPVPRSR